MRTEATLHDTAGRQVGRVTIEGELPAVLTRCGDGDDPDAFVQVASMAMTGLPEALLEHADTSYVLIGRAQPIH